MSRIVKWSDCLVRTENGLLCTFCGVTMFYDFSVGEDFIDDTLPVQFRHLKYGVKRYLVSNRHNENVSKALKTKEDQLLLEKNNKESAINCAASAYLSYQLNTSYAAYESIVTEMHNSGASMGVKNHSKEFSRNFLPHVHKILRQELTNFIMANDLPIGLLADKITINHRTRHIIGIRIPIFDIQRDSLFQTLYLEHQWVDDSTGEGLVQDFINTLEKFGFNKPYIRKNLAGVATDGQYIRCGIAKHLKSALIRDIAVNWDPMHCLELAHKHSSVPKAIQDSLDLIQETMKEFGYGKNFETLLNCSKSFDDFFYKPKIFKTMKFIPHTETVIETFLKDYKSLVSACENTEDLYIKR